MKKFNEAITGETDNDFYQENFNKICEDLESGSAVWLYCWCSGLTRCEMVKSIYLEKLSERYGERLKKGRHHCFDCYYLD